MCYSNKYLLWILFSSTDLHDPDVSTTAATIDISIEFVTTWCFVCSNDGN